MSATLKKFRKKAIISSREVWVVEDDVMLTRIISKFFQTNGIPCRIFSNDEDFLKEFKKNKPVHPLLLLDYYIGHVRAADLVSELKKHGCEFSFIVMTGRGDEHLAVEIMKAGAMDYIIKSDDFVLHLPYAVQQAFSRIDMSLELQNSRFNLQYALKKQKRLNAKILRQKIELEQAQAKAYKLLTNVLPEKIAGEILTHGTAKAKYFSSVSILFADVKDFSSMALAFSPIELVQMLDDYFCDFDHIIGKLKLEKIKTIGDCYMCAGGIPESDPANAYRIVIAGLQIQNLITEKLRIAGRNGHKAFDMRIGIHTGEVVAGVVGHKKFSYDVWGDAANTASWIVHAGSVNKVNISRNTYEIIRDFFICKAQGLVPVKNNKRVEMFLVERLLPKYSSDKKGIQPNDFFWEEINLKAPVRN